MNTILDVVTWITAVLLCAALFLTQGALVASISSFAILALVALSYVDDEGTGW